MMIKKATILTVLTEFPEELLLDQLIERLLLIQKIESGIVQSEKGELVSESEARKRLGKWLK